MSNEAPKRRWNQFSLLTLMIVVTLFTVTIGWGGYRIKQARENWDRSDASVHDDGAKISKLAGNVSYGYHENRPQTWLEKLFRDPGGPDDPVGTWKVWSLTFVRGSVTNNDLVHLGELQQLQELKFYGTNITDSGLEHLKGLTNLQHIEFYGANITDAGLVHLKGLTKLEHLDLTNTKVTDEGIKNLQQALPNCKIYR